jgi:hypothetical protein
MFFSWFPKMWFVPFTIDRSGFRWWCSIGNLTLFDWTIVVRRVGESIIISTCPLGTTLLSSDFRIVDETITDCPFRSSFVVLVITDILKGRQFAESGVGFAGDIPVCRNYARVLQEKKA